MNGRIDIGNAQIEDDHSSQDKTENSHQTENHYDGTDGRNGVTFFLVCTTFVAATTKSTNCESDHCSSQNEYQTNTEKGYSTCLELSFLLFNKISACCDKTSLITWPTEGLDPLFPAIKL